MAASRCASPLPAGRRSEYPRFQAARARQSSATATPSARCSSPKMPVALSPGDGVLEPGEIFGEGQRAVALSDRHRHRRGLASAVPADPDAGAARRCSTSRSWHRSRSCSTSAIKQRALRVALRPRRSVQGSRSTRSSIELIAERRAGELQAGPADRRAGRAGRRVLPGARRLREGRASRWAAATLAATYLRKGDWVGETAVLLDEPWPFSLTALEHVELVKLSRDQMQRRAVASSRRSKAQLWETLTVAAEAGRALRAAIR